MSKYFKIPIILIIALVLLFPAGSAPFRLNKAQAVDLNCLLNPSVLLDVAKQITIEIVSETIAQLIVISFTNGEVIHVPDTGGDKQFADSWRALWSEAKDRMAEAFKEYTIAAMTNCVYAFISGEDGQRKIVQWQSDIQNTNASVVDRLIDKFVPELCDPFEFDIEIALRKPRFGDRGNTSRVKCTLDRAVSNIQNFKNRFDQGGFSSYVRLTQTSNLPDGAFLEAKLRTEALGSSHQSAMVLQTLSGDGFFPKISSSGNKIVNPGSVIKDIATKIFEGQFDFSAIVDDWTGVIQFVVTAFLQELLTNGFESVISDDHGGFDPPDPPLPPPPPPPAGGSTCTQYSIVRVFDNADRTGACVGFSLSQTQDPDFSNDYFVATSTSVDDHISSIEVANGYIATFYMDPAYGGASLSVVGNISLQGLGYDNDFSSFTVREFENKMTVSGRWQNRIDEIHIRGTSVWLTHADTDCGSCPEDIILDGQSYHINQGSGPAVYVRDGSVMRTTPNFVLTDVSMPSSGTVQIAVINIMGQTPISILQQPSVANGFEAIIVANDSGVDGRNVTSFDIVWTQVGSGGGGGGGGI